MAHKLFNRFFSWCSIVFFEILSPKFKVDALKNVMDVAYIFYEKTFHKFDFFVQFYFNLYAELIENEIQLAGITKKMNILVIGCGSIPVTSILLATKTKVKTVGIDKDRSAVFDAKEFITDYDLQDYLSFAHVKDFSSLNISFFDLVFIAYGIKNELEIFEILGKNMKSSAKVVYRIPLTSDEQKLINRINHVAHFSLKDKISTPSMGSTVSLLLQKE